MSAEDILDRLNDEIMGLWEQGADLDSDCWALVMHPFTINELSGGRIIDPPWFMSAIGKCFRVIKDYDIKPGIVQIMDLEACKFQEHPFGPVITLREYYGIRTDGGEKGVTRK